MAAATAATAATATALPKELRIEALPPPGERFRLGERIGAGVYGEVFEATDAEQGGRRVAVKVVTLTLNVTADVREEYAVLRRLCSHPNLPELHGAFLRRGADRREPDQLWFVLELCEGGPITDLVTSLHRQGRRLSEEHIAYVLKETAKALWHLHENHVIHRDVKGSNILLTKDGEVKLVDFGLARELASTMGRSGSTLGSPCWMAPEVVAAREAEGYDNRADVWALGIVAIELADGRPPFHDMHPTRALFQIARNPPPTLSRPANWTQVFNDFIEECLTKNPEYRPYMVEILEHPFLTELQQNDYTLQQELRVLGAAAAAAAAEAGGGRPRRRPPELAVRGHLLQASHTAPPEPLRVEDLSALEPLEDDALLEEVVERYRRGEPYTFAGDVLLALGPVARDDDCYLRLHAKYRFKSRSDNAPHAFAVADRALQDALHHEEPQHVVLAGEACAGKSAQLRRLLAHFVFLGKSAHNVGERVERCLAALTAFGNAATPLHGDSTRHLLRLQLAFTRSGRLSGAAFHLMLLEKWRVHCADSGQANFHVLYYLVDALEEDGKLRKFGLEPGRSYAYLRRGGVGAGGLGGGGAGNGVGPGEGGPRFAPRARNATIFRRLEDDLREALGLEAAALEALWAALAAVLLLGELRFRAEAGDGDVAAIGNPETAREVARLLAVDERRLCWALLNYCAVESGRTAVRRRHTVAQAGAARHALAATLYARLVDWLVNVANWRLSFTRAVYGDPHVVNLIDMFGFECQRVNGLEQLFVNTLNEQLQYYYNQRVFAWELREHSEEELPVPPLRFADNRATLDALLARSKGLLHLLDDPSLRDPARLLGALRRAGLGPHVRVPPPAAVQNGALEFSVAHFTGTVTYRADGLHDKNRDFLPPDLVEVLRQSAEPVVQQLFSARLTKEGNLTMLEATPAGVAPVVGGGGDSGGGDGIARRRRWGTTTAADKERRSGAYNTASRGRFSQSRGLRTASAVFRAASLEALRALAGGGLHAVRCLRASLAAAAPRAAQPELLRQQLRALAVPDTARARRDGFPGRVPFAEFIRRYKFLAFDYDENVEETPENCRLLLVRLKMEGWRMGRSKVFLTYYNEEYLARLYETQVKKIVRVQTMLRAFLAKRLVQKKAKELVAAKQNKRKLEAKDDSKDKEVKVKEEDDKDSAESKEKILDEESAAIIIQKQYRGYRVRKQTGPTIHKAVSYSLNEETLDFIRSYCQRWRAKTLFQVLMLYRAARRQDFVYFCQQVHLYNQQASGAARGSEAPVPMHAVNTAVRACTWLSRPRLAVRKLPFRLCDVDFVDTTPFCQRWFDVSAVDDESEGLDDESWDAPLTRRDMDDFSWPAPHRVRVRDQEAQTGVAGGEAAENGAALNSDLRLNTLKRSPFRRDTQSLDETQRCGRRPALPLPDASTAAATAAPAPAHKAPEGTRTSSTEMSDSPGPRRQPAPPPPHRSVLNSADPITRPVGVQRRAKPDHIAELQLLGKRPGNVHDGDSDEEPPFNFKGMLRKTNCNRDSFKSQNKNGKISYRDVVVQGTDETLNQNDLQCKENTYNNPDVSKLPNFSLSKYDVVPSYTRTSPSDTIQKESNDLSRSDERNFEMNVENSHGKFSYSLSYDNEAEDRTHDNREGNSIYQEGFSKTSKQQEGILNEMNWAHDVNSNVSGNFIEDGDVTELVPGIKIQGNQVADL